MDPDLSSWKPMTCQLTSVKGYQFWPDSIFVHGGALKISFRRTIRVKDSDGLVSSLPPDLGALPLFPIKIHDESEYYSPYRYYSFVGDSTNNTDFEPQFKLPPRMQEKGGLFFPLHVKEAIWIKFEATDQFLIKVAVGGVNAVSGIPIMEENRLGSQDYLVTPQQRWLDGVAVAPGQVRQFVAVPMMRGQTVEAQMTNQEIHGGIQIEVVRRKDVFKSIMIHNQDGNVVEVVVELGRTVSQMVHNECSAKGLFIKVRWLFANGKRMEGSETLRELGVDSFTVKMPPVKVFRQGSLRLFVATLDRDSLQFRLDPTTTISDLKQMIAEDCDTEVDLMRLHFGGKSLENGRTLSDYDIQNESTLLMVVRLPGGGSSMSFPSEDAELGIAVGGLIKQSIQRDTYPFASWDHNTTTTMNVQILSSAMFEAITGFAAPPSPINAATYQKYGLPFFDIPEEPSAISGRFGGLKSLKQLHMIDSSFNLSPSLPKVPSVSSATSMASPAAKQTWRASAQFANATSSSGYSSSSHGQSHKVAGSGTYTQLQTPPGQHESYVPVDYEQIVKPSQCLSGLNADDHGSNPSSAHGPGTAAGKAFSQARVSQTKTIQNTASPPNHSAQGEFSANSYYAPKRSAQSEPPQQAVSSRNLPVVQYDSDEEIEAIPEVPFGASKAEIWGRLFYQGLEK